MRVASHFLQGQMKSFFERLSYYANRDWPSPRTLSVDDNAMTHFQRRTSIVAKKTNSHLRHHRALRYIRLDHLVHLQFGPQSLP